MEGDPESEVGTGMKGLPKVTLGPCKGSAGTVPSLRASLITSSRIFTHKLDRWDDAGVRFGEQIALMELRPRTKRAELRLSVWSPLSRALSTAVDRVQTICSEAIEKLEDTLRRLDKVVATAYPVSLQSLGIGKLCFCRFSIHPEKIYLTNRDLYSSVIFQTKHYTVDDESIFLGIYQLPKPSFLFAAKMRGVENGTSFVRSLQFLGKMNTRKSVSFANVFARTLVFYK